MERKSSELVPPDGGWGWVVCIAYALNNVIIPPMISGFGLIFQQRFAELGMSALNASIIINLNHALGIILPLFSMSLLRTYGYRKIAIVGALCVFLGILLTSKAKIFLHFISTYCFLIPIGIGFVTSSFSLAIDSFFLHKRGKAMMLGRSITGLGSIIMPLAINALLEAFGVEGTVVILGALALHSVVAALLLRPVKWYLKEDVEVTIPNFKTKNLIINQAEISEKNVELKEIRKSVEYLSENENDYLDEENKLRSSQKSFDTTDRDSGDELDNNIKDNKNVRSYKWWDSKSVEINLGSSVNIFEDPKRRNSFKLSRHCSTNYLEKESSDLLKDKKLEANNIKEATESVHIINFFDHTLLKDPIFVNIMLGISIAASAEINFALLTPFILHDLKYTTREIANLMSVIATSDIIFRFLAPFIGDWCHKSERAMYLVSLLMLIFTRTSILFASSYSAMLVVAFGLGVAKGIRSVFMSQVMPNYISKEKQDFASGIQMLTLGIILITVGPMLGLIRDISGSYNTCIICVNVLSMLTIVMWTGEFLYVKCIFKNKNSNS